MRVPIPLSAADTGKELDALLDEAEADLGFQREKSMNQKAYNA